MNYTKMLKKFSLNQIKFYPLFAFSVILFKCSQNYKSEQTKNSLDTSKIKILTDQIRKDPYNPKLYVLRAKEYLRLNKKDSTIRDFNIAYNLDSLNDSLLFLLTDLQIKTGKINEAKKIIENFLSYKKESELALYQLANIHFIYKDYLKAKIYIDEIFKFNPDYPLAHFLKALVQIETNQPNEAIKTLHKVIELQPSNSEAYNLLGLLYHELENEIAVKYYKTAAEINPKDPNPLYNLGIYYLERSNYDMALFYFYQIINKINSKHENAYYSIGYVYAKKKIYNLAISYFDTVLQINPKNVDAIYNIGYCYEKMKNFNLAKEYYMKAKIIKPNYEKSIIALNRIDSILYGLKKN